MITWVFMFCLIQKSYAQEDTIVVINTSKGIMKFELFDDTPTHKRKFLEMVRTGYYDSLMFHRIIKDLMIQGGEPDARFAGPAKASSIENPDCILKQEISSQRFHKRGALAAVNQNDERPNNKSSCICQFFIVLGKRFSDKDFQSLEIRRENQLKQKMINFYLSMPEHKLLKDRYDAHLEARNNDSLNTIRKTIMPYIEADLKNEKIRKFTIEEKRTYATLGGAPHLDGNYTVFGELIEGWETLDKIAAIEVVGNGKPKEELRIQVYTEVVK